MLSAAAVLATTSNATLLWRLSIGCHHWGPGCWLPGFAGTDSSPTLSTDEQTLAIGSYNGNTYGVTSDGTIRWTVPSWSSSAIYDSVGEGTPVFVPGGNCFIIAGIHTVKCLDSNTGAAAWSWTPEGGGQIASCGAVDLARGLVFVGTLTKTLTAVNVTDGHTVWSHLAGGEIWATHGPALVGDDLVCTGVGGAANPASNCDASVHCLDRANGVLRWKQKTGHQIQSTPAVGGLSPSHLYVGDYDGCLYAFDSARGAFKWRTCTQGRLESSPTVLPFTANHTELVIVGSGDGSVYAFDGRSGEITWAVRLGPRVGLTGGGVGSTARIADGVVYIGGPDALWALEASSGRVVSRYSTLKMVGSSPAISRDSHRLYVGGEDGYLYAFLLPSGSE